MLNSNSKSSLKAHHIIVGGGEMGERIRAFEWTQTNLGSIAVWPQSLRMAVNMILQSPAPLMILWGREGITLYNNAYRAFAGGRHPDLLGSKCEEVWPEATDIIHNVITTCLGGEALSYKRLPYSIYRNDQPENIWMDLDCSPIPDEHGTPAGTLIVNTETTLYVQAEQTLTESEERFRAIFNQTSVGIAQCDLSGKFVLINDRYCKMVGRSREELYQMHLQDITHPDDLESNMHLLESMFKEGAPFSLEKRYLRPDGSVIWVHINVSAVKDQDGTPLYILGICQDISENKRAEEALQESEERFRTMAEASGILIAHTDETGHAIYFNKEWLKLTGRTMNDLISYDWSDLLHPDDRQDFINAYKSAAEKREVLNREFRLLSREGEYRWQLGVLSPRFGPNGTFAGYISSCVDITELKQAEENLAIQSQLTKTITNNATVALFMMDAKGRTTFMNPAAEKISGYTFEEAQGQVLHDLTHYKHPDGSPFPMEDCTIGKTVFSMGQLRNHEDVFIHKDGSFYPVLCSASAIWDKDELKGLILEVQDISERKQAEDALRESEERFRSMADNISQFAWMADEKGDIYWYNKRWYEYTGTTYEEVRAWGWQKVHHPDHRERVMDFVKKALQKEEAWELEFPLRKHDGSWRWFLTRAIPIRNDQHAGLRWFGTNTDITELKMISEQLAVKNMQLTHTNNDLDNFVYTASHDLKAPIHNIEGLVNMLNKSLGAESQVNQQQQNILEMIHTSIDRFKNTIKDLTQVARVQSESKEDVAEITFKEVLEEVKLNIKSQIDESNAQITDDFSGASSIYFARKNLSSIVYNLVSNAIKYRSPDRPVVIHITTAIPDNNHILLTVHDNGLGIKEEDKDKVFTMFKRLHQHVEGTGIGMAIVKRIIDNNGGKIEIESKVGQGSTFKVYFRK